MPINKRRIMKIENEHFIGAALGLIPLFVIASIFRNHDVLYMHYTKLYTAIANTALTSIEIMQLIEELKRDKIRV